MATKNKKIETRLDPETYKQLEHLAEQYGTSIYNMVQICINLRLGIGTVSKNGEYRILSCAVNEETYNKLNTIANELGANMPSLVWSSILYTVKKQFPQIKWD